MKTLNLGVQLQIQGDGSNFPIPFSGVNTASPYQIMTKDLAAGDNTVEIPDLPAGSTLRFVAMVPGKATVNYLLKKLAGDAGFPLGAGWPVALLPTSLVKAGTFVVNVDADDSCQFILV